MIALILDKSVPYLDFQKNMILEQWGKPLEETEVFDNFSAIGETTIFGDAPTAIVYLSDVDKTKKMVSFLQDYEKDTLHDGLIICCSVARNSTKKLEAEISRLHGTIHTAKENSKDKTNIAEKMLDSLSISRDIKQFLISYAGDDYDTLIPLIKTISKTSDRQQSRMTLEDMLIRIPHSPGSIPPWEIEKPLWNMNSNDTIETYRRIIHHAHYLVVVSILKNKIVSMWKIASLLDIEPRLSIQDVSNKLHTPNNYPLKISYDKAKKIGYEKLQNIVEIIALLESQLKGGSQAEADILVELTLIKIINILKA